MGKITYIYLTDEEAKQLQKFCEENQCTQYSALKTALRELLSSPIKEEETSVSEEERTRARIIQLKKSRQNYAKKEIKMLSDALSFVYSIFP